MKRSTNNKAKSKAAPKGGKTSKALKTAAKKHDIQVGGLNRDLLRSFTEFMREEGLASFTFKSKEFEVELKFGGDEPRMSPSFSAPHHSKAIESPRSITPTPAQQTHSPSADTKVIKSPFVGTFYRSAGPGKPTFVEVGSVVKPGDALCILEAMKLMNEIEAEFKCKIVKILVDDASPVEYGESLFEVEAL